MQGGKEGTGNCLMRLAYNLMRQDMGIHREQKVKMRSQLVRWCYQSAKEGRATFGAAGFFSSRAAGFFAGVSAGSAGGEGLAGARLCPPRPREQNSGL